MSVRTAASASAREGRTRPGSRSDGKAARCLIVASIDVAPFDRAWCGLRIMASDVSPGRASEGVPIPLTDQRKTGRRLPFHGLHRGNVAIPPRKDRSYIVYPYQGTIDTKSWPY